MKSWEDGEAAERLDKVEKRIITCEERIPGNRIAVSHMMAQRDS